MTLKLSVVIQAGGESRRMGCNKALVPFLGQPLIQRVIDRVAPVADEIVLTGNRSEEFHFLNVPVFPDLLPGKGPLGGLYTALSAARFSAVAVVACDMPFISAALLDAERSELLDETVDAVVPSTAKGFEPFHAVYRRDVCRDAVKRSLDAGESAAYGWFTRVRLKLFLPEMVEKFDPDGTGFINVNTIEDLHRAEDLARKKI